MNKQKSVSEYKSLLNESYAKYYLHYGKCKYYDECSKNISRPCKYYSDKVKIGDLYNSDPSLPNVMFVGLEAKHPGYNNQEVKEIMATSIDAANAHYRGLRYVLSYLLAPFWGEKQPENTKIDKRFDSKDIMKRFALSNVYKCAFGNENEYRNLPHSDSMKKLCQIILFDEIDILEPDIVVMQFVNNKPECFWDNIINKYSAGKECLICGDDKKNNTSVYAMKHKTGKPFLMIWSYHGAWPMFASRKYLDILDKVLDATVQEYRKND